MSSAIDQRLPSFQAPLKRKEKLTVEPLVGLHRILKLLDDVIAAISDPTWLLSELRAILKTISSSVDLLKPMAQNWASVTQELKDLVVGISGTLKRVSKALEAHIGNSDSFSVYINGPDFVSDYNKVVVNTHVMQLFLLRFGINGGLISEVGCAQYTLSTTRWRYAVVYLPDRNLLYVPRHTEAHRLWKSLRPETVISYCCLHPPHGVSGVGITELVTEHCYRAVEDGLYGAIAWITAGSASSVVHSFRSFAKRVWQNENTFCDNIQTINKMTGREIISKVINWIQKLPYAWLLVFDGVRDERVIENYMIPQFGYGNVVFSTLSSCLNRIKEMCAIKPGSLEVNFLGNDEKKEIADCLLNYGASTFPKADLIDLIKYFSGYPLELIEACSVINTGNNRLQLNIGIHQYLNKLKFSESHGLLERDIILYQSLNAALDVAVRLPRTCGLATTAMLDLLPYIDCNEIDAKVVLNWLAESDIVIDFSVIEDDLEIVDDTDVVCLTMNTLVTIVVNSVIPHDLHSNGGTHHTWKIQKTFLELQTFFDDMKKSSDSLATVRFPGKPHVRNSLKPVDGPIKVPLGDINFALQRLCQDNSWKVSCADNDVQGFLGIVPGENVFSDAGNCVYSVLEPLASVGILRLKHSFGRIDSTEHSVSFSVCADFHRVMVAFVQQEGRESSVLDKVHDFFLTYTALYIRKNDTDESPGFKVPPEVVIPHIIRAVSFSHYTSSSLALVTEAFYVAETLNFTSDQAALAEVGLSHVRNGPFGKKGTTDEITWLVRHGRAAIAQNQYDKALSSLNDALQTSTDLSSRHDIAVVQAMLALVAERMNKLVDAEKHLVKSLEAWQMCFHETKQRDVANCLKQLARVYRLSEKIDRSLEFDSMAIDVLVSMHGLSSEIALEAKKEFGIVLMQYGKYDAAVETFTKILQCYDAMGGDVDFTVPLEKLNLTNRNSASVCLELSNCYIAKKMFSDAESVLNQCLDSLFSMHREIPQESVGLVLAKLGQVQTHEGHLETALKSFKDSLDIFRCIYDQSDIRIAHSLNKIGNHLKLMGKFAFAESYFKGSVEIFEKKPCSDGAYALLNLADMLLSEERADEALVAATKSVDMYHRIDTSEDAVAYDFAVALTLKADIYRDQDSLEKSLSLLEEVLFILDSMASENDAAVAEVYEKMADIYRVKDMDTEASRFEKLAMTIYDQNGGTAPKKLSKSAGTGVKKVVTISDAKTSDSTMESQKISLQKRQDSSEAMEQKDEEDQSFLKMQEELITNLVLKYGEKHQRVASALNNLSHLLIKKTRYDEAHRMLVTSLEILLDLYGDCHAHIATVYQNIGHLYQRRGRYEEAEALYQQALSVRRDLNGDVSAHVAQSLNSLGLVLRAQGKYQDAKLCMEESLNIRRVLYGHNHFSIAVALNNLGMLQKNMSLLKDAEKSLRDGLAIKKATFDKGHPAIATSMANLGTVLIAMGMQTEARRLFEDALTTFKKAYGQKGHPDIVKLMSYLADLNVKENKLSSAKTVLEEMIRSRSDIHGAQNEEFYLNIARLSRIYHGMNMTEEGSKLDSILSERATATKTRVDDKFVMLPEIEEEDKIVSRLMSVGSFADGSFQKKHINVNLDKLQHNKNHEFLTPDHEELPRWLAAVNEELLKLYRKRNQEAESACDVLSAIETTFEDAQSDLQGLKEELKENKSKVLKLEKLGCQNSKYEREIIDVQYDSAHLEKEIERSTIRKTEIESELSEATENKTRSKIAKKKLEDVLPVFESLRVNVLGSIASIDGWNEALYQKRQNILDISERSSLDVAESIGRQKEIDTLEKEKNDLEGLLRSEKSEQEATVERIYEICKKFDICAPLPSTVKKELSQITEKSSGRKRRGSEDDDDISIISFESDDKSDGEEYTYGDKKGMMKLKKKIKHQKMLIDLLRSQLIGAGIKPIEEVVSFERAEARLKEAMQRLFEGDEEAAAEFERWDEFVRNHPEYKRREAEKLAIWMSENIPLGVSALRNVKSFVPVDVYTCKKDFIFSALPKALARRVWNEKALWLLRMSSKMIAKLHIVDLQSKYSTHNLDEIELRAVFSVLPENFDNDATGEKQKWRSSILQRLQSKRTQLPWSGSGSEPPEEVVTIFMKSLTRNGAYRNAPEEGPFDPDAEPLVPESPGATFGEAEKYDPNKVHQQISSTEGGELAPAGSILETVQLMHSKFSNRNASLKKEESVLTEEEERTRRERRRASLAKLRNQKATIDDVESTVLHSHDIDNDEMDDSFEMFPPASRATKPVQDVRPKGGMLGGLQDAILKRRAMLDNTRQPSFRQKSSRNIFNEENTSAVQPSRPGQLAKGESFRAAPGRGLKKGESFRAPESSSFNLAKSPSRRAMMTSTGKQESIRLTGPHHLDPNTESIPPRPGMVRQPSMLQKLFAKKSSEGAPMRGMGSPQKSSFNMFSSPQT